MQPKESWRCVFDIVTPQSSVVADAEVISFISDVVVHFKLTEMGYKIFLNHVGMLRIAFDLCGFSRKADQDHILDALSVTKSYSTREFETAVKEKVKMQVSKQKQLTTLAEFLTTCGSISDFRVAFKSICNPLPKAAKDAIEMLQNVCRNSKSLTTTVPIVLNLSYVNKQHAFYDGMIFRVCATTACRLLLRCFDEIASKICKAKL